MALHLAISLTHLPFTNLHEPFDPQMRVPEPPPRKIGEAAFSYYAPKRWNALPQHREAETIGAFKRQLKTHLFNLAYSYGTLQIDPATTAFNNQLKNYQPNHTVSLEDLTQKTH